MQRTILINHQTESHAIPFNRVLEALSVMAHGSDIRVMFEMCFLTGCRMAELNVMRKSMLYGNYLYWPLGKNQTGMRKEFIPNFCLSELKQYWEHHRVYGDKFFGIDSHTFTRYFNRDIRPLLNNTWHEMRIMGFQTKHMEYILQLKGLRKDFQSLLFAKELNKWKDASVALEFTSKKMHHSSTKITAYHYIENFDTLQIDRYGCLTPEKILTQANEQRRIIDFL